MPSVCFALSRPTNPLALSGSSVRHRVVARAPLEHGVAGDVPHVADRKHWREPAARRGRDEDVRRLAELLRDEVQRDRVAWDDGSGGHDAATSPTPSPSRLAASMASRRALRRISLRGLIHAHHASCDAARS